MRGKLIAFEGTEGVGKTTQVKVLVEWLNEHGIEAIATREPGGSDGAEAIRKVFLDREWADHRTEIMLTMAARMDHLAETVKPALGKGTWVVSDRFTGSMRAYQGKTPKAVQFMISLLKLCDCPVPDLTILLQMDVETALERARKKFLLNRYDKYGLEFHRQIRERYNYLAERNPKWEIVDAQDDIDVVSTFVRFHVKRTFSRELGLEID